MIAPYASFTFKDHLKRIKRKTIQYQTQSTLVDYQAVTTALVAALDTIVDLELVKVELTLPQTGSFAEDANSNIDVGATFTGVLYNKQGQKAALKLPGIKLAYSGNGGVIDVTDTDIAAFLAFFVQATPFDCYVSDTETIDTWETGSLDK